MAIEWYNMYYGSTNIVSVGIDWQKTETDTQVSIQPLIYRWDKYSTDNYGSKWSESLSPDPVGAGSWSGLSWGSGSGTRQIDSFAKRTYTKGSSASTITYKMSWDSSFGSWSDSFRTLGSGSHTWTLTVPAKPAPSTYTVNFNANGGIGGPTSTTKTAGTNLYISALIPTRVGYRCLGWATSSTATSINYKISGVYSTDANITLYAVWEKIPDTYEVKNDENVDYILVETAGKTVSDVLYKT